MPVIQHKQIPHDIDIHTDGYCYTIYNGNHHYGSLSFGLLQVFIVTIDPPDVIKPEQWKPCFQKKIPKPQDSERQRMNFTESPSQDVNVTSRSWMLNMNQFIMANKKFLLLLMGLFALAGNLLTLVAFVKFKKLRTSRYMMIASLAVCDALIGAAWSVQSLAFIFGILCHVYTVVNMSITVTFVASHLHVLLMAVDRFIALTAPFRHTELMSRRRILSLIAAAWAFGITYALSFLFWGWEKRYSCIFLLVPAVFRNAMQFALYILVLIMMAAMYGSIWRVAKRQAARTIDVGGQREAPADPGNMQMSPGIQTPPRSGPAKATKFISTVVGVYLGTWLMHMCVEVISMSQPSNVNYVAMRVFSEISLDLMVLNSCLNIFIYVVYLKEFRNAYRRLLCCKSRAVLALNTLDQDTGSVSNVAALTVPQIRE